MAEQDWLTPATASAPSPYMDFIEVPRVAAPAYELRPLTLGELLDRTFSLYRSRFWLFAGISTVSGAIYLAANVAQLVLGHFLWRHNTTATASIGRGGITLVVLAIYFVAYSVTQAATTFALSEVYLGKTATIGSSLRATASRWYVYACIALWQGWSLAWLPLVLITPAMVAITMRLPALMIFGGLLLFLGMFGGTVFGVIAYLRNGLAIQATVLEHLAIRKSMRRSKDLTSGAKWRLFVVFLVATALYMVFGVMQMPLLFFVTEAVRKGGEAIGTQAVVLLISFVGHTLVTPVALIGCSLLYFDQRVRREAFDIAVLLGEPGPESFRAGFDGGLVAAEVARVVEAQPVDFAATSAAGEAPVYNTGSDTLQNEAKAPDDPGV